MTKSREPDALSATARRWVGQAGVNSDPKIIALVLEALRRDYGDVVVVEGIVRWRIEHGLRSGEAARVGEAA